MVIGEAGEFKVEWKDPQDARLPWMYDPVHFPAQLLPLGGEFLEKMYARFMSARVMLVNGFAFHTLPTPRPPSPEILERGALDIWTNDYQPQVRAFCERIRSADYDSMSLAELGAKMPALMDEMVDTFGLTMKVITGFMGPTFGFVHLLQEHLGPEGAQVAATLLQGYENGSSAAGAGLGQMAQEAAKRPAVAQALREGRYDSLAQVEGGREFLAVFNEYLDEYGWRAETFGRPEIPTWKENPRLPLMLIGRYLADPDRSPEAAMQRAVRQREEAEREVEAKLSSEVLPQFRAMLAKVRAHVPVSEGRALWQLITIGSFRVPLLALGRKLVATGALASPDDVFYLTTAELAQAAQDPSPATRALVASRRADYERWSKLQPPPFLGQPLDPSQVPAEMAPMVFLFFGAGVPDFQGREIKGQAASKGVVRARARIIHSLAESERLQTGEVLVCTTTAPPWTPLFAIAGGVVTDSGGVLSHSAICAREYAIPCVVATQIATKVIPDGAMVTVDGGKGIVTIEG
jgi:phosphohistidine swiveling domain-containing protein